jgi:lauroyl/myristoyl acyltransferase
MRCDWYLLGVMPFHFQRSFSRIFGWWFVKNVVKDYFRIQDSLSSSLPMAKNKRSMVRMIAQDSKRTITSFFAENLHFPMRGEES